jgi:hypothetical protein
MGVDRYPVSSLMTGLSKCDQPGEPYGTDTQFPPSYNECTSSFDLGSARRQGLGGREHMLWTIFVVLLIMWLLGFSFHVGGGLIHLLLVCAVIVLVWNLITGRRSYS